MLAKLCHRRWVITMFLCLTRNYLLKHVLLNMNAEYQRVTGNKLQSCLSIGDFLIIMIEDYYIDSDQ